MEKQEVRWRLKRQDCEIAVLGQEMAPGVHGFKIVLVRGAWPTDRELITALDNGSFGDETFQNFGGRVRKRGNTADVDVYFD